MITCLSCFRTRYKRASNKFSSSSFLFMQYFQFFNFLTWDFIRLRIATVCIFFWINWTQIYTWAISSRLVNMKHSILFLVRYPKRKKEKNLLVFLSTWTAPCVDSPTKKWNEYRSLLQKATLNVSLCFIKDQKIERK